MSLRRPLAVALAVSVLGLTGCGVTDAGIVSGTAVSINGTTISVDEVDQVAGSVCAVLSSDPGFQGQTISGAALRGAASRALTLHEIVDQLVEDFDVSLPASAGQAASAQYRAGYANADPADVEAAEPIFTADARLSEALVALGTEAVGAAAGQEAIIAAGVEQAHAWQEDAEVRTNPAFDAIEIGDDRVISVRDDLTVATTDFAVQASAQEVPEGFAASLPESQRCGA